MDNFIPDMYQKSIYHIDYDKLKELEPTDGNNPSFKKAFLAVKERHDDISLSVKLIRNRLDKLSEDLKIEYNQIK